MPGMDIKAIQHTHTSSSYSPLTGRPKLLRTKRARKMKIVIFCQLALLFTTLTLTTSAWPTSLNFMTKPDNFQIQELDLSDMESAVPQFDEDLSNSDLVEGDINISPEEREFDEQNNAHVRVIG